MAAAGSGEILISEAVRDAIPSSQVRAIDRGAQELKGVPGRWHLYRLKPIEDDGESGHCHRDPAAPAVSGGGLQRDRPGSVPDGGRIDLERPARSEEVGDVERILWIRLRRKEVACNRAANPFGDDIADVGRASWRRPDPQGHGLVIETGRATHTGAAARGTVELISANNTYITPAIVEEFRRLAKEADQERPGGP
jgi:hypothetical protein